MYEAELEALLMGAADDGGESGVDSDADADEPLAGAGMWEYEEPSRYNSHERTAAAALSREPTAGIIATAASALVSAETIALSQLPYLPPDMLDGRRWPDRFAGRMTSFPPAAVRDLLAAAGPTAGASAQYPFLSDLAQMPVERLCALQRRCDALLASVSDCTVDPDGCGSRRELLRQSLADHCLYREMMAPMPGRGRLIVQPHADGSAGKLPIPLIAAFRLTLRRPAVPGFAYILAEDEEAAIHALCALGQPKLMSVRRERVAGASIGVAIDRFEMPVVCASPQKCTPCVFELCEQASTPEAMCGGCVLTVELPVARSERSCFVQGYYTRSATVAKFTAVDGEFILGLFAYAFHVSRRSMRKNSIQPEVLFQRRLFMACASELRAHRSRASEVLGLL
jgi:hypothetical protein